MSLSHHRRNHTQRSSELRVRGQQRSRIRRRCVQALLSLAVLGGPGVVHGDDADTATSDSAVNRLGGISILVHEHDPGVNALTDSEVSLGNTTPSEESSPNAIPSEPTDIGPGTHDSVALVRPYPVAPVASRQTSVEFDAQIAATVAGVASSIGIPVESVLEPLAMIDAAIDDSLASKAAPECAGTAQVQPSRQTVADDHDSIAASEPDVSETNSVGDTLADGALDDSDVLALERWWRGDEADLASFDPIAEPTHPSDLPPASNFAQLRTSPDAQHVSDLDVSDETLVSDEEACVDVDAAVAELAALEPIDVVQEGKGLDEPSVPKMAVMPSIPDASEAVDAFEILHSPVTQDSNVVLASPIVENFQVAAEERGPMKEDAKVLEPKSANKDDVAATASVPDASFAIDPVEVSKPSFTPDADAMVGAGPVIASIPEPYFPYDIAQRDLELLEIPLFTVAPIANDSVVRIPTLELPHEPVDLVFQENKGVSPDCQMEQAVFELSQWAASVGLDRFDFLAAVDRLADIALKIEQSGDPQPDEDALDVPLKVVSAQPQEVVVEPAPEVTPIDAVQFELLAKSIKQADAMVASLQTWFRAPARDAGVADAAIAENNANSLRR